MNFPPLTSHPPIILSSAFTLVCTAMGGTALAQSQPGPVPAVIGAGAATYKTATPPNADPADGLAVEIQARSSKVGSFMIGGRKGGSLFGLFFELDLEYAENGLGEGNPFGTRTSYAVGATIRGRLAKRNAGTGIVELFLHGDFGLGEHRLSGEDSSFSVGRAMYFAGSSIYFWPTESFAIGGRLGLRGDYTSDGADTHLLNTDTGLQVMAVF